MLEKCLIDCCSPTLASLKLGSLFNYFMSGDECLDECVDHWNKKFTDSGLKLYVLRKTSHSALIYMYRHSALQQAISNQEVTCFLDGYGYCSSPHCTVECYLEHLRDRINYVSTDSKVEFPHEIGIFLGYPLYDVQCFIENHGKNCKYTGIWKVYGDTDQAIRSFAKFDKCRKVYQSLWQTGKRDIMQLTVAG